MATWELYQAGLKNQQFHRMFFLHDLAVIQRRYLEMETQENPITSSFPERVFFDESSDYIQGDDLRSWSLKIPTNIDFEKLCIDFGNSWKITICIVILDRDKGIRKITIIHDYSLNKWLTNCFKLSKRRIFYFHLRPLRLLSLSVHSFIDAPPTLRGRMRNQPFVQSCEELRLFPNFAYLDPFHLKYGAYGSTLRVFNGFFLIQCQPGLSPIGYTLHWGGLLPCNTHFHTPLDITQDNTLLLQHTKQADIYVRSSKFTSQDTVRKFIKYVFKYFAKTNSDQALNEMPFRTTNYNGVSAAVYPEREDIVVLALILE